MLKWLTQKDSEGLTGRQLLDWWYSVMEKQEEEGKRKKFYSDVVVRAKEVPYFYLASPLKIHALLTASSPWTVFHHGRKS